MPELTYLRLVDEHGLAPNYVRTSGGLEVPNKRAGELDNLTSVGLQIPVPSIIDGEHVGASTNRVEIVAKPELTAEPLPDNPLARLTLHPDQILDPKSGAYHRARIVPGTRVIETDDPAIADLLRQAHYEDCPAPTEASKHTPKPSKEA